MGTERKKRIGKGIMMTAAFSAAVCVTAAMAVSLQGCTALSAKQTEAFEISDDNKLILYTSHKEEVYGPIVKEFEERTGIWVDVHAGGTTEMLEKVESSLGLGTCDVMFGGGVESYEAYRECFEPYACSRSELLDTQFRSQENMWTIFTELPIVFIYNDKLVGEEEAPRSWEEFLGDKWRGRIAFADPRKSGTSYTALATMAQILQSGGQLTGQPMGQQTEQLAEQQLLERFVAALNGNISAGSGEVVQEVGTGVRLVGITLEETARKAMAAGADIGMVYPQEGTSAVPDGCALVKGAPHEENAKLFIDFTVSDDVQKLVIDQFCRRTVRTDIKRQQDDTQALGALKIVEFDLKWAGEHQQELLKAWAELAD